MVVRILKTLVPFLTTFSLAVVLMSALDSPPPLDSYSQTPLRTLKSSGSAIGSGSGPGSIDREDSARGPDSPLRIFLKPSARYTDEARANNVQGKVRLKMILLASGRVGQITVVDGLPDGLTEQAIEAARDLRFEPAIKDGVPVTGVITIDYAFTIY